MAALVVVLGGCTGSQGEGRPAAATPPAVQEETAPSPTASIDPTADLVIERESQPLTPGEIRVAPQIVSELSGAAASATGAAGSQVTASQATQAERTLSDLGAARTPEGLVVTLPEQVLFDFDEATIRPSAEAPLGQIAEVLAFYEDTSVDVRGHTDSRGEDAYNQDLSERRAAAVRDALAARGTDASRMQVRGFGETQPVAPNQRPDGSDDPDGRQRNRRVEVVILQA